MKTLQMCNIWKVVFFAYILKSWLKNDNILSGIIIKSGDKKWKMSSKEKK